LNDLNGLKKKMSRMQKGQIRGLDPGLVSKTIGKINGSFVQCANFMDLFASEGSEHSKTRANQAIGAI